MIKSDRGAFNTMKDSLRNLLKWTQGHIKTDMLYLVKGGSWLFFGQAITFGTSFVLTWIFANFVSKETFGAYRYILSIATILSIPTLSGLNTALVRAVATGKEGVFPVVLRNKLKWGSLGAVASIAMGAYYFFKGNSLLAVAFLTIACFIPLINSFSLYEQFLAGKKDFKNQNKYKAAVNIGNMVCLGLVALLTKNLILILLVYFASWTSLHLIFLIITFKKQKIKPQEDRETIKFGKHLTLMGIFGMLDSQLDKVLLWHFLGADQLAVFTIALTFPSTIGGLLKIINGLAMPKLSQAKIENLKQGMKRKTTYLFLLVLPITIAYLLLAPLIFKVFFPKYQEAVLFTQIAALSLLFFPRALFGTALTAQGQTKALYMNTAILSPLYIISLLVLVPTMGIMGAILASLVLELGTFTLQAIYFKKMR